MRLCHFFFLFWENYNELPRRPLFPTLFVTFFVAHSPYCNQPPAPHAVDGVRRIFHKTVEQPLPELAVFRELHEDEHDGDGR